MTAEKSLSTLDSSISAKQDKYTVSRRILLENPACNLNGRGVSSVAFAPLENCSDKHVVKWICEGILQMDACIKKMTYTVDVEYIETPH